MRINGRRCLLFLAVSMILASLCPASLLASEQPAAPAGPGDHDLVFKALAQTWDEAIPLGNGFLGALVWNRNGRLRISLDRSDLWDLRPMPNLDSPQWTFAWVQEQWRKNDYGPVQQRFDIPYDAEPAPSKIPAAALEFDLKGFSGVESVRLFIEEAVCRVRWADGRVLEVFVEAGRPAGRFRFRNVERDFRPTLVAPPYGAGKSADRADSVTGQELRRLGYPQGTVRESSGRINYHQQGWGGFYYDVAVAWKAVGSGSVEGVWSISSRFSDERAEVGAEPRVRQEIVTSFDRALAVHQKWWRRFWSQSWIKIPDKLLEKQWFLEQYKFGSAARRGAPPISLQAVWTADNGKLPPWKGDFHHDLNTELSYWPCYSANHLEEGLGFLDWLWSLREEFERYSRAYFGSPGLNVPGVTTLTGQPMGGWIQYSFSPTCSAWLGQHFYWHWRYSQDRTFLAERAYPWIRGVAVHLRALAVRCDDGRWKLPLSSSPEIFDNTRRAWFAQTTNYDLALIRWTFETAAELAEELGFVNEARAWREAGRGWPEFAVDSAEGLMFAPGVPYHESHRHFSHQMAFHPLGLIDWSKGEADRKIIRDTLANLDLRGPDAWCGYSYAWLAGLRARAFDGQGAAEALRIFASCFCLPNSFHANGDQSGTGKSKFIYRPFTLEGNFAFASGLQEMLLQSHSGTIRLFPAVPDDWREASFDELRAEGAFLLTAEMSQGKVRKVRIISEKGGRLRLANPFPGEYSIGGSRVGRGGDVIEMTMRPGQAVILESRTGVGD